MLVHACSGLSLHVLRLLPSVVAVGAAALESLHKLCQLIGGVGQSATSVTNTDADIAHTDADTDADAHTHAHTNAHAHVLGHAGQRRVMEHPVVVHPVVRRSLGRRRVAAHHVVGRGLGPGRRRGGGPR